MDGRKEGGREEEEEKEEEGGREGGKEGKKEIFSEANTETFSVSFPPHLLQYPQRYTSLHYCFKVFYVLSVDLSTYMSVHHMHARSPMRSKKGIRSYRTKNYMDGYKPPCRC